VTNPSTKKENVLVTSETTDSLLANHQALEEDLLPQEDSASLLASNRPLPAQDSSHLPPQRTMMMMRTMMMTRRHTLTRTLPSKSLPKLDSTLLKSISLLLVLSGTPVTVLHPSTCLPLLEELVVDPDHLHQTWAVPLEE